MNPKAPKIDMFERRKQNAKKEKSSKSVGMIFLGFIITSIIALGALNHFIKKANEPLKGDLPQTKKYDSSKITVFQPKVYYSSGETAQQGTAFIINYNGLPYAVTCNHYIDFKGPKVNKIELLDPSTEKVIFTLDTCLGKVVNNMNSLTSDFLLMPIDSKSPELDKCNVLRLLRDQLLRARNVFMPLKSSQNSLYARLEMLEHDFLLFSYNSWHTFSSESGSPLIGEETNILKGILARADDNQKVIMSPPLKFVREHLNKSKKFYKLNEMF